MTRMGECAARAGARPRPFLGLPFFLACVLLYGTLGEWKISFSRLRAFVGEVSVLVGVFKSARTAHA